MVKRLTKSEIQKHDGEAQVLAALPGEDAADALLVEVTVKEINETWRKGGLETARKVGELVVNRFFDGVASNAHSRKRTHKSYQALVAHPGLRGAASHLWYCVAVFEHFGVLPVEVAEALTVGHHRVLAHVKSVEQRVELAQLAATDKLTVGELKAAIAEKKVLDPDAKKRGRPAFVPVVKQLNLAKKVLAGLQQWDGSRFVQLGEKDRARALGEARSFADAVAGWMAGIEVATTVRP